MSGYDWASLVRLSAERAGFNKSTLLRGQSFSKGGEVSPSLQFFLQRVTNTEVAPIAWLGVYVEEFEREWLDRLRHVTSSPQDLDEDPPFCLLADNIERLRPRPWAPANTPSSEDAASMRLWCDHVFEHAEALPSSMPDLITAITKNDLDGRGCKLWNCVGHPVKVRGFVGWLARNHGLVIPERRLAELPDRTEPYDLSVMLDDRPGA